MSQQLKIVMAQLNLTVGAIQTNTDRVLEVAREAIDKYDADLVAFPELTLTSYPPEDLLLRSSIKKRIDKALKQLLDARLDIYLVVGYPHKVGERLYNALSVIRGGEILATYHKQQLPNYQVFDERRYFDAGDSACVIDIKGVPTAFTICEDMWQDGPTRQARHAGARLMININASPYHLNKVRERQQLLERRSTIGNMPIVYVNLVGGQDELVFDGASMVVDADGQCRLLAAGFQEALIPVAIQLTGEPACPVRVPEQSIVVPGLLEKDVYQALVLGVRDYVNKNGFSGVVIGLSGGIDSAVTLAVAVDALGRERVRAVMMPFEYTARISLDAAQQQADTLGVHYSVIPIGDAYHAFIKSLEGEFAGLPVDVSEQNIQARCRGVLLMAISNKKGLLVLTTGNKSEIAVGYSTLYGDMAGGFDVLKDVSKTLVYRLARYRNEHFGDRPQQVIPQIVIDRPPSAELAPDQVDEDNLPPYSILDQILELYVEQDLSATDIIERGFDEAVVRKVLRLVDLNEYKRRQSPVGVRLTRRGFGRDRRYPITNAWEIGD
ncbi:MAG: NAD+ synthase [Gammaproteobacteria bacterium]|nr:NAD+ synthase [Pseudomonadales bacterium]MCP5345684.1 NAD+ synthase [Pseudomonadales bacterium]